MSKLIDLAGQKYGRLTVVCRNGSNVSKRALWLCKCECGNEITVIGDLLRNGHVQSCGCLLSEYRHDKMTKHGYGKHNDVDRLYRVWRGMKTRCYSKNAKSYKWYGARGIKVCDEWQDYTKFREWAIKNGYDKNAKKGECTIDRINPDGDYEPNNCRWVGMDVQSKNKRKKETFINKGMTNGEVLKAMFPDAEVNGETDLTVSFSIDSNTPFTRKWWNAPYQKGGKGC